MEFKIGYQLSDYNGFAGTLNRLLTKVRTRTWSLVKWKKGDRPELQFPRLALQRITVGFGGVWFIRAIVLEVCSPAMNQGLEKNACNLPSGYGSGVLALEEIFAVDLSFLAASGLGYHGVPADVELLAVLGMGEGGVGQHAAVGALGLAFGAGETIGERFWKKITNCIFSLLFLFMVSCCFPLIHFSYGYGIVIYYCILKHHPATEA